MPCIIQHPKTGNVLLQNVVNGKTIRLSTGKKATSKLLGWYNAHLEFTHPVRHSFAEDLKAYSDEGLHKLRNRLDNELYSMDNEAMRGSNLYEDIHIKFQEVCAEMKHRGLKREPIPLYEVDDDEELPF